MIKLKNENGYFILLFFLHFWAGNKLLDIIKYNRKNLLEIIIKLRDFIYEKYLTFYNILLGSFV